ASSETTLQSTSMPRPGPSGTRTQPFSIGNPLVVSLSRIGVSDIEYSTKLADFVAAQKCKVAASSILDLKACGIQRRPRVSASAAILRASVKPPARERSG